MSETIIIALAMVVGSLPLVVVHHPGRRRKRPIDPGSEHILDHLYSKGSLLACQSFRQDVEVANGFLEPEKRHITESQDCSNKGRERSTVLV